VHQAAGGVVDIDEQRALRTAILEPPVLGTVDVHQFAEAIAPSAGLMDALQRVLSPNPKAGVDHPLPQGLDTEIHTMKLGQPVDLSSSDANKSRGIRDRLSVRQQCRSAPAGASARCGWSVTSLSVRPVTFLSVIYRAMSHKTHY